MVDVLTPMRRPVERGHVWQARVPAWCSGRSNRRDVDMPARNRSRRELALQLRSRADDSVLPPWHRWQPPLGAYRRGRRPAALSPVGPGLPMIRRSHDAAIARFGLWLAAQIAR